MSEFILSSDSHPINREQVVLVCVYRMKASDFALSVLLERYEKWLCGDLSDRL